MPDNIEIHNRYFPYQTETYPQIYAYELKLKPDEIKDGIEIPDWNIDKKEG